MPARIYINLKIGSNLRELIRRDMNASDLLNPFPGIVWGQWSSETEERYVLGYYEGDKLPEEDGVNIIEGGGIEFLTIQDWVSDDLDGKEIDIENGILVVKAQVGS